MIRKIYLLLFATVLISSCSSDDGGSDGSSIVGTWDAVEFNTAVGADFNQDGTASQNLMDEVDCFASTVTFTAEGGYSTATTGIYFEASEESFSITCDGVETTSGTYELNGNTLVTIDENGEVVATVTVTKDRLVVEGDDEDFGEVTLVFERR
ncbi:lipocalin family protein [Flagellimonas iocasae]|uniref:Lipocalin family protein n=1 Tax=Flagellimonas iocasae TaxID=2055905 RepID=A0ABW4Y312_9FLAO